MGRAIKNENEKDRSVFIGIDNGISGSIGIISQRKTSFFRGKEYTKGQQDYTKKKKNITRIDHQLLLNILLLAYPTKKNNNKVHIVVERPMVNPGKMQASFSALRSLEATLVIIEQLGYSVTYLASTDWQKVLLPKGCKGPELKKASLDIGCRLFPQFKDLFIKQKDADGMLMAEYCRRLFCFDN